MYRFAVSSILMAIFNMAIGSCTSSIAETVKKDTDHIIILAFDGWGASSFDAAEMPFLKSILPESAWTLHKRSILPTSSACNWASMFKGAGPEAHGYIAWDTRAPAFDVTDKDEKGSFPSLFSVFRNTFPEREMGYLYQWEGMKYIFDMDDFDYTKQFDISVAGSDAMKDAVSYIKDKSPSLALFVWDYPDKIGHTVGWYTDEYMKELSHIDSIIEAIFNSCIEAEIIDNTLFVITSDHGGHDKTHGQANMLDLETPFILYGKKVLAGEIKDPFMQYDVASVLADYLFLEQPKGWRGKAPEAFIR